MYVGFLNSLPLPSLSSPLPLCHSLPSSSSLRLSLSLKQAVADPLFDTLDRLLPLEPALSPAPEDVRAVRLGAKPTMLFYCRHYQCLSDKDSPSSNLIFESSPH